MSEAEIATILRTAIRDCGLSLNQLAKESGVSQPQLSRFMAAERSLTLDSVEKLFAYFKIRVQVPKPKKPKGDAAD